MDRNSTKRVVRVAVLLAPVHAALPALLGWVGQRYGPGSIELAIGAIHLLFPFLYLLIAARIRFGFAEWALLLGLNHAAILAGALPRLLS